MNNPTPSPSQLPFKISVLIFIKNTDGKFLMIQRKKAPNKGCWSPVGGKLEMTIGESPFECARREAFEETGIQLENNDLHLFGMVSERSYEGSGHWLMFLFNCLKPLESLPPEIDEGNFSFFSREEIDLAAIPPTDKTLVWPVYDSHGNDSFLAYRAQCGSGNAALIAEESMKKPHQK